MAEISGGCLCGAIRFSVRGAPKRVGICHCLACRKHHGAVFYAAAVFPEAELTLSGEPTSYEGRFFCRTCGSSVFSKTGDEVEVHLGALDDPNQFEPTYELWARRREAWLPTFSAMMRFEEDRE